MQIVLEHIRVQGPNLTEIHCFREEAEVLGLILMQVTGKRHLPVNYESDYSVFISDQISMEEAEALLFGMRQFVLPLENWNRQRLAVLKQLQKYLTFLETRQTVHNLERNAGFDSYDYADADSGES